jgi:hypothetical protein
VFILVAIVALLALNGGLTALQNRPGAELDSAAPLRLRSDVGMEAVAFQLENVNVTVGQSLDFTLYWRALRYLDENYRVQVSLVSTGESAAALTSPFQDPGGYPTRRWLTGRYIADSYLLLLPDVLATGAYNLRVEVFDCRQICNADSRLTFFDPQGASLGQSWLLPVTIQISS